MYNEKKDNKCKTKNNQTCQKIKLYGSLTNKDLKKPYLTRQVGEVELRSGDGEEVVWWQRGSWQNGQFHSHVWWIKIKRDTLEVSNLRPRPDHLGQVYSTRKIKLHNFWL